MRIAHENTGSNYRMPARVITLAVALLLLMPLTGLWAQETGGQSEVSTASLEALEGALVIDIGLTSPASVRTFRLTSPDRIVFDLEDTVLTLDEEAVTQWDLPLAGIRSLEILQFSTEPPVVRVFAEISDDIFETDRMNTPDGLRLALYSDANPFEVTEPDAPPATMEPIIERLWHETMEDNKDRFVIDFSFGVVLPQIRVESPTILLLTFPGTDVLLPASHPDNFAVSVEGNVAERMRAERIQDADGVGTEIRLTVPDTSLIGYTLETGSEDTIELILMAESAPEPEPPVVDEPEPLPVEGGQLMVLSTGDETPSMPEADIQITRVQFQSIDADTDRFYVYYEGGEIEPNIQRFNYPTRIAMYIPDSAVILPENSEGRFQSVVSGVMADELKVFNRVIEDVGPESQFIFYFPGSDQENIGFTVEFTEPGAMHIDFYRTAAPLEVESPVEVNTTIDAPQPEPVVEETPQPEPMVEEPEVIEEPEIEIPEVIEEPVVVEEPVEIPEPVVSLPVLNVQNVVVNDSTILFTVVSSEPMPLPEIIEYHYPERIGLRFPLADVQLLDAEQGIYTNYTHVRAVPIVRAIVKDRDDEQHTTLTFTLEGTIEEYGVDVTTRGAEILVALEYSPIPEVMESTEPVEEPVIDEPEPEPVVEEPVVVPEPEPEVVEEPEVIEEPEVVVEPEIIEEPEVVEEPGVPGAPGNPPFATPVEPDKPVIEVEINETSNDTVSFVIHTSETMPVPEWIEYRYPDRLGLRFPLSEVVLLGDSDTFTTYTHIGLIPMIRNIVKDRAGEQYVTVAFTLDGSLDDYEEQLDWNGNDMIVTFRHDPVIVEEPVYIAEAEPVEEPEVIEEPVEIEEPEVVAEPVPVEEPQVIEEPVVVEEPEVIEEPEVVVEPEPIDEPEVIEGPVLVAEVQEEEIETHPIEPEPVDEVVEISQFMESEEVSIVEVSAQGAEFDDDFDGVRITGIEFETRGDADVITLMVDGYIDDYEVNPMSFPTKFNIKLNNARTVAMNGDALYYDERVNGAVVTQYNASPHMSDMGSFTSMAIMCHDFDSPALLDYEVEATGHEWTIAIFRAGEGSPMEVRRDVPQPEPVRDAPPSLVRSPGEGVEITPVRDDLIEELEEEVEIQEEQPTISLTLEDANIRDVLQVIAEQANLNVSIDSSVTGSITIKLEDVGLFDALELLGDQMGFSYFVKHGVYIFGDPDVLRLNFGEFFDRWYISVSYADPDQIRNILVSMQILSNDQIQIYRGTYGGGGFGGGTVIASPRLVLTGEIRDLQRAYQVLAAIDQAPTMIQVDFKILNTSLTDNQNFGFNFNFGTGTGQTNLVFNEQVAADPDMGPLPQGFDRQRQGTTGNTYNISYVVNYLVEEGYAELVNSSSISVANNQQGQLFVGENIPYRSTYQVSELGRVTQRVATQSVGLQLNFRPHANPDGTVTMFLTPSNSNLLELTDVGPRTVDQRFSTTIRVQDGEPFIIGGFIRDEERVNYDRFPFLSELPLLGHLFRNREVQHSKSELIFVVTPNIIYPDRHLPEVYTDDDLIVPIELIEERTY